MNTGILTKKIYKFLKKHYHLIIGSIFALLIVIWGLIYYQYIYVPTNEQINLIDSKVLIDEKSLQQVLLNIEDRENNLDKVIRNTYPNVFTP